MFHKTNLCITCLHINCLYHIFGVKWYWYFKENFCFSKGIYSLDIKPPRHTLLHICLSVSYNLPKSFLSNSSHPVQLHLIFFFPEKQNKLAGFIAPVLSDCCFPFWIISLLCSHYTKVESNSWDSAASTAKHTEPPHLLPQTEKPSGTLDFSVPRVLTRENPNEQVLD